MLLRHAILLGCWATSSLLIGCAQVAPWQRGNLAKPAMTQDSDALQRSARAHVHDSREAATGGGAASGGGCGCY